MEHLTLRFDVLDLLELSLAATGTGITRLGPSLRTPDLSGKRDDTFRDGIRSAWPPNSMAESEALRNLMGPVAKPRQQVAAGVSPENRQDYNTKRRSGDSRQRRV